MAEAVYPAAPKGSVRMPSRAVEAISAGTMGSRPVQPFVSFGFDVLLADASKAATQRESGR